MPAILEIHDGPDSLVLRSDYRQPVWCTVLVSLSYAVGVIWFSHRYLGNWAYPLSIALGLTTGVVDARKQKNYVQLTASEANVQGDFRGGYIPDRCVPLAAIQRLEYQDETGGGEFSYKPSGLYAELEYKTTCLLPNLSSSQTQTAIDAIYRRFPQIPINPPSAHSFLFPMPLTTLNIGKHK